MKIAIATHNGKILSDDFVHSPFFAIYEVEKGKIVEKHLRQNKFTACPDRQDRLFPRTGLVENVNPDCKTLAEELHDCDVVVGHSLPRNQWEALRSERIQFLITGHRKVQKAAQSCLACARKSK